MAEEGDPPVGREGDETDGKLSRLPVALFFGLFFAGATVGYLVGGSKTSLAATAFSSIFGIVAVGFTLLKGKKDAEGLSERIADARRNAPEEKMVALRSEAHAVKLRLEDGPRNVGLGLVVLSVAFLLGSHIGARARIEEWYRQGRELPWDMATPPRNFDDGLALVVVQENLIALGYERKDILTILSLPREQSSSVERRQLPWDNDSAPKNLNDGLALVTAQENLIALGYEREDILKILALPRPEPVSQKNNTDTAPAITTKPVTSSPLETTLPERGGTNPLNVPPKNWDRNSVDWFREKLQEK